MVVRPASDQDVHWSLSGNPIFDDRGRFLGFRGIGTDLTEQRRSEREITRLARFDSLTGLPNRAMMRQTLEEALRNAAHRQKGCALFMIDLDRFKNVNDTLGHPIGDALLRQVADRLKSVMGNHGQVGRLGGDEFQAVLPGIVDIGLLESLARTLIEQVSRPYVIEGHKVTIGASVGIAIGDPGRASADAMVRNADLALYAAKAAGRGKHCFYQPSMHSEAAERQLLENDLRQAIERGELSVAYQPIVHAAGEDISGFEALVRWQHPTRGPISPDLFVPLAEEAGPDRQDRRVGPSHGARGSGQWPDHVRISVNLSPLQFNDPGVVGVVAEHLKETGVRAERLELEITEGVFLAEGETTDDTFAKLKALGVRLALDDFGTGYSSLGYLKKAPFDKIKIDQSFVRGAASTSATNRNAAIIRAIVTLAETLGMDTCAEGVETHDDLQLIRELGVSMVQGYIFGRPSPSRGGARAGQQRHCRGRRLPVQPRAPAPADAPRDHHHRRNHDRGEVEQHLLHGCAGRMRPPGLAGDRAGDRHRRSRPRPRHRPLGSVGQVRGPVRQGFDLATLAPKREKLNRVTMLRPDFIDQRERVAAGVASGLRPAVRRRGPCHRNHRNRRSTCRSAPPSNR